jgi:hypothetical protein
MHWRIIPDVVAVVVHTNEAPSDEDWDRYIDEVAKSGKAIKGVLVYTPSVGPSAPQRARSSKALEQAGMDLQTAIMTTSRMVRGIVTAMTWAVGGKVKAFSTMEFNQAVVSLGLSEDDQLKTRVVLKQLARAADVVVDSFADESGQFMKKVRDRT